MLSGKLEYRGREPKARQYLDGDGAKIILTDPKRTLVTGKIKDWYVFVNRSGEFHIQVWRPTNETKKKEYELVVDTKFSALKHDYPAVKQVTYAWPHKRYAKSGDVIGLYFLRRGTVPYDSTPEKTCHKPRRSRYYKIKKGDKVEVGARFKFKVDKDDDGNEVRPCRRYSIKALMYYPD